MHNRQNSRTYSHVIYTVWNSIYYILQERLIIIIYFCVGLLYPLLYYILYIQRSWAYVYFLFPRQHLTSAIHSARSLYGSQHNFSRGRKITDADTVEVHRSNVTICANSTRAKSKFHVLTADETVSFCTKKNVCYVRQYNTTLYQHVVPT